MVTLIFRHIFSFVFSTLIAFYVLPLVIKAAKRLRLLDKPDGTIKVHKEPIPFFGGMAIYIAFITTLALAYPFENTILWLLLGVTLLLFIGLIDDCKALMPGQKFFGQTIAVLCFLKGGFSLKTTFFSSSLNLFFSSFWMLTVINAFNLIDVMDGLTATVALTAGTTFFIIALMLKQHAVSVLLLAFLGPLVAFFYYNRPPAKIYLGDSGSMFIGGFLAAIPMLFSWSSQNFESYYTPVIILGIPLLEVFFLVVIRTYLGIPFYKGSPHHFSIYLMKKGMSKYGILAFTALTGICLSLIALAHFEINFSLTLLMMMGCAFIMFWSLLIFSSWIYFKKSKIETHVKLS